MAISTITAPINRKDKTSYQFILPPAFGREFYLLYETFDLIKVLCEGKEKTF
jgi:hypothetical protein